MQSAVTTPFTKSWFESGQHLGYDKRTRAIDPAASLKVWIRVDGDVQDAVTFLPGYPDGSIGRAKVLPYLPNTSTREAHIVPKYNAAGVRKFAFLLPSDSVAIVENGTLPAAEGSARFPTGYFGSRERAFTWFDEP